MKKRITPLVDEHLESVKGIQMTDAGDFFYSKLRSKMLAAAASNETDRLWRFPLKPVWVMSLLLLLLGINGFMLTEQFRSKHSDNSGNNSSIQNFAKAYDQTINSTY